MCTRIVETKKIKEWKLHLVSISNDKIKRKKNKNPKNEVGPPQKKQKQSNKGFFCNKVEHIKNDCTKYQI